MTPTRVLILTKYGTLRHGYALVDELGVWREVSIAAALQVLGAVAEEGAAPEWGGRAAREGD